MIIAISNNELAARPIPEPIQQELDKRGKDKSYILRKVPFVRINALQHVVFNNTVSDKKQNNLNDLQNQIGLTDENNNLLKSVRGFSFEITASQTETYSSRQLIGRELNTNKKLFVKNPRRIPPPQLQTFTAEIGKETLGYYTKGTLTFEIFSKEQFDFLSMFLFRPGNTLFIEFGYSDDNTKNLDLFSGADIGKLINDYVQKKRNKENGGNQKPFINSLEEKIKKTGGNYEYLIAQVLTYSIELTDNLGYRVTVELVSRSRSILSATPTSNGGGDDSEKKSSRSFSVYDRLLTYYEKILDGREYDFLNSHRPPGDILKTDTSSQSTFNRPSFNTTQQDNTRTSIDTSSINTNVKNKYPNIINDPISGFDQIIDVNTKIGYRRYISLDRIFLFLETFLPEIKLNISTIRKTNEYVYSNSPEVLIFKNNHKYPLTSKEENGDYIVNQWETVPYDYVINYLDFTTAKEIQDARDDIENTAINVGNRVSLTALSATNFNPFTAPFAQGLGYLGRGVSTGLGRVTTPVAGEEVGYGFKAFKPMKFDSGGVGDLRKIYYDLELFTNTVKQVDAKPIDILNEIVKNIDKSTNGLFQLSLAETTDPEDDGSSLTLFPEENITADQSILDLTYTFKVNQKESVINDFNFNLNFDGAIADRLYYASISKSDSSVESTNINNFLFDKTENGIKIFDLVGDTANALQTLIDDTGKGGVTLNDSSTNSDGDSSVIVRSPLDYATAYVLPKRVAIPILDKSPNNLLERFLSGENTQFDGITRVSEEEQQSLFNTASADALSTGDLILSGGENIEDVNITTNDVLKAIKAKKIPLFDDRVNLYLDRMNKEGFIDNGDGDEEKDKKKGAKINPVLETRVNLQIPGIGGLQPLQVFSTDGLPSVYDKRYHYIILNVQHQLTYDSWETTIDATTRKNDNG